MFSFQNSFCQSSLMLYKNLNPAIIYFEQNPILNNKCFTSKWEGFKNEFFSTITSIIIKLLNKFFQWLYSENPYIRMNLLYTYPQVKNFRRIFTFSKWKNVTELFLNIKFAAVAKFPLDKVKP